MFIAFLCKTLIKKVIICYQIFGKFAKAIKIDAQLSKLYNIFINNMKPEELQVNSQNVKYQYNQPNQDTKGKREQLTRIKIMYGGWKSK